MTASRTGENLHLNSEDTAALERVALRYEDLEDMMRVHAEIE